MSDLQVIPAIPKTYDPSQEAPLHADINATPLVISPAVYVGVPYDRSQDAPYAYENVSEGMEVLYYAGCSRQMKSRFEIALRTRGYDYVIKRIAGDSTALTSDPYLSSILPFYMNKQISHVAPPVKVFAPEEMAAAVKKDTYHTCLNSLTSFNP